MISNLSFVHPNAQLGANVTIEPFAYIGDDVFIGDNTWIGPHATIMAGTRMGHDCQVFPGAVVGAIPQDLKYKGENSLLEIGHHVIIRECVTLNRGTEAAMTTRIGNHNLIMAYVHVAHDCMIGNHCIIANSVNLAGHVELADYVILGGMSAVHQFVKIGEHAMVGGGSLVRKDVPPYVKAAREPLSYVGVNAIGLSRRGFSDDEISTIHDVYRILFVTGNNTMKSIETIEATLPSSIARDNILTFVKAAERGLMKGYSGSDE
jgi:UDP-N-acetylglucosamine acyltransferase